jgi:predicted DNA-binding protein (MmcQ/YjbR family)
MAPRDDSTAAALAELRAFGLTYPGAHTKSPWPGHLDLAVNDKTFAYLSVEGDPFKISCKLPHSNDDALSLPFVAPTEYGLGKSGWVTARPTGPVPVDMFKAWIDESYRAQAPKRLVAALAAADGAAPAPTPARGAAGKKRTAKKQSGKKRAAKSPPGTGRTTAAERTVRASKPGVQRAVARKPRAGAKKTAAAKGAKSTAPRSSARSRRPG